MIERRESIAVQPANVVTLAAIGFVATSAYTTVSFEGRSLKVYLLGISYQTVSLLVMGAILGAWR